MGIIDRIRTTASGTDDTADKKEKKTAPKKAAAKKATTEKAPKKAAAKKTAKATDETAATETIAAPVAAKVEKSGISGRVLISGRISEKAARQASAGTYVFNIAISATKTDVRKAVEALYGVDVTAVRIIRNIGKFVRRGRIEGQRNNVKKALVTVKAGQSINLYEGV